MSQNALGEALGIPVLQGFTCLAQDSAPN
jgi:hypothetical protein